MILKLAADSAGGWWWPGKVVIEPLATMEHSRVSRAAPRAGPAMVARKCGPAGLPRARTSLGQHRVVLGRAAGGPSGGRTRCALLTCYAFGDDNIGAQGFIAAVTRTAGPRPFGGAGLCVDQWLGGRDSELTCVCSRTGVSNGPGDSYPVEDSAATDVSSDTFLCAV